MFRLEAVSACALLLAAFGSAGASSVNAQDSAGDAPDAPDVGDVADGPAPVNSSQSLNAGDRGDIAGGSGVSAVRKPGSPGHASGTYKGVVPGAASPAPPAAKSAKAAPTITWPGFQMRPDGSSRVFIQSTSKLEPKVSSQAGGKFEVQLPGARVAEKTNRLPLDTRYFNTPVTKVSVNAARSGAVVMLDLRATVTPQVSSEPGPDGYFFTYIELPKGEYLKTASAENSAVMPTMQLAKPNSRVIGKPLEATEDAQLEDNGPKRGVRADATVRGNIRVGQ